MNFSEAMEKLKSGSKVTRKVWKKMYLIREGETIHCYFPLIINYNYNADILISERWQIGSTEGEFKFCEIIPHLLQGRQAKLSDWGSMFLTLDKQQMCLVLHSMEKGYFSPEFDSFIAEDWIEL